MEEGIGKWEAGGRQKDEWVGGNLRGGDSTLSLDSGDPGVYEAGH